MTQRLINKGWLRLARSDSFGCGSSRVKGHAKVLCHTTFAGRELP